MACRSSSRLKLLLSSSSSSSSPRRRWSCDGWPGRSALKKNSNSLVAFSPDSMNGANHNSTVRNLSTTSHGDNNKDKKKPSLGWIDLRGSGWSWLERLCLEEYLGSRKGDRPWLIVGNHEATEHRHIDMTKEKAPEYIRQAIVAAAAAEDDDDHHHYNPSCAILVGDQYPSSDLNIEQIQRDGVLCLQYTGETDKNVNEHNATSSLVLDHSSLLTTYMGSVVIGDIWRETFEKMEEWRLQQSADNDSSSSSSSSSATSSSISNPLTMVLDTKSCSKGDNSGKLISLEDIKALRKDELGILSTTTSDETKDQQQQQHGQYSKKALELTYGARNIVKLGPFPIGWIRVNLGNVGPTKEKKAMMNTFRTIFYWDYDADHASYLLLNSNNNSNNNNKSNLPLTSYLKLRDLYPQAQYTQQLQQILQKRFDIQILNSRDVLQLMAQDKMHLQDWWKQHSNWKIVQKF